MYTYWDNVAGKQNESCENLSEIIGYIEKFGWHGDSEGVIFEGEEPLLWYTSREDGITWSNQTTW